MTPCTSTFYSTFRSRASEASKPGCRSDEPASPIRGSIGLQFHLETTPESANAIITNCVTNLLPQRHIQTEAALRGVPGAKHAGINALMTRVLDYLVRDGG